MKILFDQNISHKLHKQLDPIYHESKSVKSVGLLNATDKEIWDFAKNNNFSIFTQDSDFNELFNQYGFPPKIIWLRTGNINTINVALLLKDRQLEIQSFLSNEKYGIFEIVNEK